MRFVFVETRGALGSTWVTVMAGPSQNKRVARACSVYSDNGTQPKQEGRGLHSGDSVSRADSKQQGRGSCSGYSLTAQTLSPL